MSEMPKTLVQRWKDEFFRLEADCPWAGPRPLSRERDENARHRYVTREGETAHFLNTVSENTLVVYHGESGAGKTSLLNIEVFDTLIAADFAPLVWKAWGSLGEQDPEYFLTERLRENDQLHPEVLTELDSGRTLLDVLDELYGDRVVLILDQFEHLIRSRSRGFNRMVDWLLTVNRGHQARVVLSLRSEHVYQLARLMKSAKPFTTAYLELKAMDTPQQIRRAILKPRESGRTSITEEAAEEIMRQWVRVAGLPEDSPVVQGGDVAARHVLTRTDLSPVGPDRSGPVSTDWTEAPRMLAVQACLYSLNLAARRRTGTTVAEVSIDDVKQMLVAAEEAALRTQTELDIFTHGLNLAIEGRLSHCAQACEALPLGVNREYGRDGIPPTLTSLARGCIIDVVDHLSSGGYKIERSAGDLFLRSKDREFRVARWPRESGRAAVEGLISGRDTIDYLAADRSLLTEFLEKPLREVKPKRIPSREPSDSWLEGLPSLGVYPGVPWLDDEDDIAAGSMLGLSAGEVLVEQLRAYAFALDWLETASLIDLESGYERIVVSLVHDGFGSALESWAASVGTEPRIAASSLVAFEGHRFDWTESDDAYFRNSPDEPRYLANIRWRYCRVVGAKFTSVVFLNCDFRGAVFTDCTFEGATFVNCLLDGASFEKCTVIGPVSLGTEFDDSWAKAIDPSAPDGALDGEAREDAAESETTREQKSELPGFTAEGTHVAALVRELEWFRGTYEGADRVYSPTSGVAAVPWTVEPSALEWEPQTSGLVMYGGRLSSLMVRDCAFSGEGQLALCYMAGSSLDFVEQNGGDIILYSTTVRGVAVTGELLSGHERPNEQLEFRAYDCVLADVFFGARVEGTAIILESKVLGISSASERLNVLVDRSAVADASNVAVGAAAGRLDGFGTGQASEPARSLLAELTERMSYRSRPAARELQNRLLDAHSRTGL